MLKKQPNLWTPKQIKLLMANLDKSYKQIAEIVGRPESSVKGYIYRNSIKTSYKAPKRPRKKPVKAKPKPVKPSETNYLNFFKGYGK